MNRNVVFLTDECTQQGQFLLLGQLKRALRQRDWSLEHLDFQALRLQNNPRRKEGTIFPQALQELEEQEELAEPGGQPGFRRSPYDWNGLLRQRAYLAGNQARVVHNWCGGPQVGWVTWGLPGNYVETQTREETCVRAGRWRACSKTPQIFVSDNPHLFSLRFGRANHQTEFVNLRPGVGDTKIDRNVARDRLLKALKLPATAVIATTLVPLDAASDLKDLIWACDLLKCIRDDVHLVVIGQGSGQWQLERFTRCTSVQQHVHFVGHELSAVEVIAAADLYWSSQTQDANPVGVLYAMRLSIPVVSVLSAENCDLIRHQQTAFAVNLGRRDQYARWSKYLLEQTQQRDQIIAQAQRFVADYRSLDEMVQGYLNVYETF